MSGLRKDDPVYYKSAINKLIKQAEDNGLEIGFEIDSTNGKTKKIKILFENDNGEIAGATVYEEGGGQDV